MKEREQWEAFIDDDNTCHVGKITEIRGLPENHYDYEEPVFLPLESIKVIVRNPANQSWRETLKRHLEAEHPELSSYQLLRVPLDPWNGRSLVDDTEAILKANLEVPAGGTPEVGNHIDGTFRVERRLGHGAAGTAFEVELIRDWAGFAQGDRFCLKWYNDEIFSREAEPNAILRRIRECAIGGSLNHRNLVKVHDSSEFWDGDKPRYVIMSLIRGQTLEELVQNGPISSLRIQQILLGIASGLNALHDRGILHRDVKSANVIVDTEGEAILLDLGVARPMTEATITSTQAFLGTLRFAAPEWLFAEECTEASDVYSLGTIAYHLLTGNEIFSECRLFSRVVRASLFDTPELVVNSSDPRACYLAELTRRMLSKQIEMRPLLSEITEWLGNERAGWHC